MTFFQDHVQVNIQNAFLEASNFATVIKAIPQYYIAHPYSAWFSRHKGPGKQGHIVADTLLPMMFPGLRKLGNICCGHNMFLNKIRNIFCVPDTKSVSVTNAARAGKRGNICVGNNVSATMCPRLPGPLRHERVHVHIGRNFLQAKLDSEINVPFLLNEHGDLYFLSHNNSVHINFSNSMEFKKFYRTEKRYRWKYGKNRTLESKLWPRK